MPKIKYPDKWICIRTCYCDPSDGRGNRLIEEGAIVTADQCPNHHFERYTERLNIELKSKRWGLKPHWLKPTMISDKTGKVVKVGEYQAIESVLRLPSEMGIPFNTEQQAQFRHAVLILFSSTTQYKDFPKASGKRFLLKNLINACEDSMSNGEITPSLIAAKADFISSAIYRLLDLGANWPKIRDGGIEHVPVLKKAAEAALEKLNSSSNSGHPTDSHLNLFIETVSKIYHDATGKIGLTNEGSFYTGELHDLVWYCFKKLKIENLQVGKRIQRNKKTSKKK